MRSIPAPADRALGGRAAALLDGEEIGARLAPVAGGPLTCTPRYARYKPKTSLLVQYELACGSARLLAHAWLFADDGAARTWESGSFERLLERARRRHPEMPFHATFLADLGVLVELSPVDSRMPALVSAASSRKLARLLGVEAPTRIRRAVRETVRHKPGRKAVLRFERKQRRLYVKLYAGGDRAAQAALEREVAAAGVPTALPVAVLPELRAVAYREVAGERLAALRGTDAYAQWVPAAAHAVATFQRLTRAGVPRAPERARLAAAGRAVDALLPALHGAGTRLADAISRRLDRIEGPLVLAHGDFYDDQLLVAPEQVSIIDLDELRNGHPLLDVGTFVAHLSAGSAESLRGAFLDSCDREGIDVGRSPTFEAAALLRLATAPFRRLEPHWPDEVGRLVDLAASRLAEDLPGTRPHPQDLRLPQLRSLGRPAGAAAALTRALGRPVVVTEVEIVRHKPGLRCTLRYRLRDGQTVFAKTYASRRADRVHESLHTLAETAKVPLPTPLGSDDATRLVAIAAVPGQPVLARIRAGDSRLGEGLAESLYELHSCGAQLARRHALNDEIFPLVRRIDELSGHSPALAAVASRCLEGALAGARRPWPWRWRPVHRDFYEDQVLDGPDGLGFIDLDDAAMSEPAVDVANLVAHLRLLALRDGGCPGAAVVSRAFIRRYRSLDPALDSGLVTLLVGTTLLRLACIHLPRAGESLARRLLTRSERLLAAACRA